MADEPSETHQFRARDGLYYDSYEKMRDANVRMNQLKLKEMGLDRYTKKENRRPSHLSSSSTTTGATPKRKKSLPTVAAATDAPVEPLRRSERTPRQSSLWSPDPDELRPKKRTKSLTTEKQKKTTHKKKDEWDSPILEALRENLKEKAKLDKHWYAQFQQYWEPQISQQNYRTICRQVEKLISGKGISYHHWPNEVCFHKDKSIDMSMDLNSLYQLACSYEAEYGPDLGKGTCAVDLRRFRLTRVIFAPQRKMMQNDWFLFIINSLHCISLQQVGLFGFH